MLFSVEIRLNIENENFYKKISAEMYIYKIDPSWKNPFMFAEVTPFHVDSDRSTTHTAMILTGSLRTLHVDQVSVSRISSEKISDNFFSKSYYPNPWQDSISRPITPISSMAGGDDTTRQRCQDNFEQIVSLHTISVKFSSKHCRQNLTKKYGPILVFM
jgi:hypothetical protein